MGLKFLFLFIIIFATCQNGISQKYLKGFVYEKIKEGEHTNFSPLPNATLIWKGSTKGTVSDENGKFKLMKPEGKDLYLVVSYIGYKTDTQRVAESVSELNIVLKESYELSEVEVKARRESEYTDKLNPVKTEVISSSGLQRLDVVIYQKVLRTVEQLTYLFLMQ
ncbi:MAG: hypothetical protein COX07_02645 [Bacteroidetes bacterium CG23_combo_of_CG06-09_8_20_14_all_32_9]|nr:MAG: hypothetical protein COX07_02645 [Bacteroidetes bacterium CG23_combo_of_CG06-09_8_20_14_all_32_9]